jgi:hypothetical protein
MTTAEWLVLAAAFMVFGGGITLIVRSLVMALSGNISASTLAPEPEAEPEETPEFTWRDHMHEARRYGKYVERIADLLALCGQPAAARLVETVVSGVDEEDEDWESAWLASDVLRIMHQRGNDQDGLWFALRDAVMGGSQDVLVLKLFGEIGQERALEVLLPMIAKLPDNKKQEEAGARWYYIFALNHTKHSVVEGPMATLAYHENPLIQEVARWVLFRLPSEELLPKEEYDDDDGGDNLPMEVAPQTVKIAADILATAKKTYEACDAAIGLGNFYDPETDSVQILIDRWNRPHPPYTECDHKNLKCDDSCAEAHAFLRENIVESLGHFKGPRALPVLVEAITDLDLNVRLLAYEGLEAMGEAAKEPLMRVWEAKGIDSVRELMLSCALARLGVFEVSAEAAPVFFLFDWKEKAGDGSREAISFRTDHLAEARACVDALGHKYGQSILLGYAYETLEEIVIDAADGRKFYDDLDRYALEGLARGKIITRKLADVLLEHWVRFPERSDYPKSWDERLLAARILAIHHDPRIVDELLTMLEQANLAEAFDPERVGFFSREE